MGLWSLVCGQPFAEPKSGLAASRYHVSISVGAVLAECREIGS